MHLQHHTAGVGEPADDREIQVPLFEDAARQVFLAGLQHHEHALLAFREHHLVGPFTEKLLIEACLELMATDAIVAIQDMGAAGLTSSSFEMASKGGSGVELDLDKVPCREEGMTPYEMMLSESQERMLMVLQPGKEDRRSR